MKQRDDHHPSDDAPLKGVRLGVDVGTVRVGVARSDPAGILATPVTTLTRPSPRKSNDPADLTPDLTMLRDLVVEHDVVEVVVGLPTTLRGMEGAAVTAARAYGQALAALIAPVPVVYVDERLAAHAALLLPDRAKHIVRIAPPLVPDPHAVLLREGISTLPSARNFTRARDRLAGIARVRYFECAVVVGARPR